MRDLHKWAVFSYYGKGFPMLWSRMVGLKGMTRAQLQQALEGLVVVGLCTPSRQHGQLHYTLHPRDMVPIIAMPATESDVLHLLRNGSTSLLRSVYILATHNVVGKYYFALRTMLWEELTKREGFEWREHTTMPR